jgi:Bardet-Biedl syndrome 1 protein
LACLQLQAVNILTEARDSGIPLSSRSLDLLALTDASERLAFIQQNKQTQIQQQTVAACMATLQKDSEQPRTVCSLVVGTENKQVFTSFFLVLSVHILVSMPPNYFTQVLLMDPSGTSILKKFDLPSVPVFMSVQGLHDVEYRIVCACRNGNIYTIKNHKVLGGPIELESAACSLVLVDKNIVVGCMDQSIHSYSVKGKKIHSLYMPERILCMTSLELTQKKNIKCLLVSLANGEIRLYNGKYLISSIKVDDPVVHFSDPTKPEFAIFIQ